MIRILKNFILILFPSVILFSQPEIIFEKTYDNNKTADFGFEIIRSSNEGFIIVGSTAPSDLKAFSDSQGLIIKIYNSGNIEKIKICSKQNSSLLTSVTRCDYGYIAVGATSMMDKFPSEDIWVVKICLLLVILK